MPIPTPSQPLPPEPQDPAGAGQRWIKCDFHIHASEDPLDELDHSAIDLLHRAHTLGFGALAITLHDHVLTKREVFDTARELGIVLIPAAEMRLEGADVIVLNVTEQEAACLHRLRDLEVLRQKRGNSVLILIPHPFYVLGGSIGGRRLLEHLPLFDAVEWCHFYTAGLNPNRPAERVARKHHKPMLATSDAHRLDAFGSHYTLIQVPASTAPPSHETIFAAIRAGSVRRVSPAWPVWKFLRYAWWIFAVHEYRLLRKKLAGF